MTEKEEVKAELEDAMSLSPLALLLEQLRITVQTWLSSTASATW